MSKSKKRRTKTYSGDNAKVTQPTVHRYTAVDRGKYGQWWHDHKNMAKRVGLYGGGTALFIFLIIMGIVSLF